MSWDYMSTLKWAEKVQRIVEGEDEVAQIKAILGSQEVHISMPVTSGILINGCRCGRKYTDPCPGCGGYFA